VPSSFAKATDGQVGALTPRYARRILAPFRYHPILIFAVMRLFWMEWAERGSA